MYAGPHMARANEEALDQAKFSYTVVELMQSMLYCQRHYGGMTPQAVLHQAPPEQQPCDSSVNQRTEPPANTMGLPFPQRQEPSAATCAGVQDAAKRAMAFFGWLQGMARRVQDKPVKQWIRESGTLLSGRLSDYNNKRLFFWS